MKFNYVNQAIQSANFDAQNSVTVTLAVNALNATQKTEDATKDAFTFYGLDASGATVATVTLNTIVVGNNTVTLEGTGIVAVKVVLTDYPVVGTTCYNVSIGGLKVFG